jgi:hypothetical protein
MTAEFRPPRTSAFHLFNAAAARDDVRGAVARASLSNQYSKAGTGRCDAVGCGMDNERDNLRRKIEFYEQLRPMFSDEEFQRQLEFKIEETRERL